MANDIASCQATVLRLTTAALALLDTDAAFGSDDPRTRWAKDRLRSVVDELLAEDRSDAGLPPQLQVLHGGAETI